MRERPLGTGQHGKGNLDVLQKVWKWANENLTREEINNILLLSTDNEGMTA